MNRETKLKFHKKGTVASRKPASLEHTIYKGHANSQAQTDLVNISAPQGNYLFKWSTQSEDLCARSRVKKCTLAHMKHRFCQQ